MTDNEIIKALEDLLELMLHEGDLQRTSIISKALDFIKRQKAEILELQKRIINWRADMDYRPDEIKAEAIKEFAERLTDKADLIKVNPFDSKWAISQDNIDNLVKEMTKNDFKE